MSSPILADPTTQTFSFETPPGAVLTPLRPADEAALVAFFAGLSDRTRRFYSAGDPRNEARDRCAAIDRYDKLRLVLRHQDAIIALVEMSFDLTTDDIRRFARHGVALRPTRDCRWGLCVSDPWQGRGVGTALAAASFQVAQRFDRDRVILLGGVHAANERGAAYYRKVGFVEAGRFTNDQGVACIDMSRPLVDRVAPPTPPR